ADGRGHNGSWPEAPSVARQMFPDLGSRTARRLNGRESHPRSHPDEAPSRSLAARQYPESVWASRELEKVRRLRGDYAEGPTHEGGLPADERQGRSLSRRLLHTLERGVARAEVVAHALTP